MNTAIRVWRNAGTAAILVAALAGTACTVNKQTIPSPTGPSEFGLSVMMAAAPDQLPRDGTTQSVVTLTARDSQGKAAANQQFTLSASGAPVVVSQTTLTTGSDGRATFAVVAPAPAALGNTVTIFATPVGSNAENDVSRSVTIAVTGPSNTTAPTPAFTWTPQNPEVQQVVTFDASTTQDEGRACGAACTYAWNFDDGTTGSGMQVAHTFTSAKAFNVALTVTDATGVAVTLRQLVSVTAAAAPTVTVGVQPNPPILGQLATFTATATPAANHSITKYSWNFGDGNSQTTTVPTVTHTYQTTGTFVVTLTVTDDLGQTAAATTTFTVSSGITVSFTISPTAPVHGTQVNFNASGTTTSSGATISSYAWDFGDGNTGSGVTATHNFGAAGTYVVRLTVTDSGGHTATTTQNVTVS